VIPRTLFLARGNGAIAWYRCALPAMALGADWLGLHAPPGRGPAVGGSAQGPGLDDPGAYDVVVVQEAKGPAWRAAIRDWRSRGATVLYEVDDWLHGVADVPGHALAASFDRNALAAYEMCMRAAHGLICSTDFLAERYREINPRISVCRNGIDLRRYALERPVREHVTIGWSGGTGHAAAVGAWLGAVAAVLREQPAARFVTVGDAHANALQAEFGPERCRAIPFSALETYPAAMAHFDVAIAPAGREAYFQGKSDLRWLEAAALGIPVVADPGVYAEIEHGATGFHAASPRQAERLLRELVADRELRDSVGAAAREHVERHRSATVAAEQWARVLRAARPASAVAG
jgi:glycosyltransferase involved in cell wall biosynthesis